MEHRKFLPIVCLVVLGVAVTTAVDQTRQPGAVGAPVVEAVINLIRESCLFADDKRFLRRLAYAQTRDGSDPKTYRPGYHGGIWQVWTNFHFCLISVLDHKS